MAQHPGKRVVVTCLPAPPRSAQMETRSVRTIWVVREKSEAYRKELDHPSQQEGPVHFSGVVMNVFLL